MPTTVKASPIAKLNSSDLHERLCRARRYIDECYDLPLDLAEISKQACLSRYHFLRLFRDTFATTPHQYLIQRRIEKAKELLRVRSLSVTDVCFEVGFQSLGSFSSLFRKCVGHAPVSYRKRERESLKKIPGCFIFDVWTQTVRSLAPLAIFEKLVSAKPLMLRPGIRNGGNRES